MTPMRSEEQRSTSWEHRQAELWDRLFQVSQDVITLAGSMDDASSSPVVKEELVRSALSIGAALVRANAADHAREFAEYLKEARLKAIETDYWLRMAYVLQQREEVQRDLSSIITQYAAIVDLLDTMHRHERTEKSNISRYARGPKIT